MTHENAPESTESDAGPESGPVSDGDAQDAREARYAEAIRSASIAAGYLQSHDLARAVIAVADAELAPLRARVAELEAEVERWKVAERRMAGMYDRAADQAVAAEAALARVEALADDEKRHLIRWIDDSHLVDVSDLRAALAAAGLAVSDGEGATSEAGWVDRHGDVWREGDDGLMHSYETAPFSREHVERKWGPLRPASPVVAPSATDEGGLAAELRKAHAQNTERPDETKRRMPTLRPAEGGATE